MRMGNIHQLRSQKLRHDHMTHTCGAVSLVVDGILTFISAAFFPPFFFLFRHGVVRSHPRPQPDRLPDADGHGGGHLPSRSGSLHGLPRRRRVSHTQRMHEAGAFVFESVCSHCTFSLSLSLSSQSRGDPRHYFRQDHLFGDERARGCEELSCFRASGARNARG